jgi:hypothetical protein
MPTRVVRYSMYSCVSSFDFSRNCRWKYWLHATGFSSSLGAACAENDTLRIKVNNLLASEASSTMILRALRDDNAKPDRVTIDSIRNHTVRHFPVQNVAKPTYRRILE